jgi:hypothetical protein
LFAALTTEFVMVTSGRANERYDRFMPESPFGKVSAGLLHSPTQDFSLERPPVRMLVMVIATLGLMLAAVGCSRPASETPTATTTTPQFSEQEVTAAQKAVCDAFLESSHAINVTTSARNDDPVQKVLISLNGRLAFQAGASHLFRVVTDNPSTPPELARNTRELATAFEEFVIARLSDKPEPEVEPLTHKMDAVDSEIRNVCK